jgi:hypothetical protein
MRALRQLELAIERARDDKVLPGALEVLHAEAARLPGLPAETVAEHAALARAARSEREDRLRLGARIWAALQPVEVSRTTGLVDRETAGRLEKEFLPALEERLRVGFADGWLLCYHRELETFLAGTPLAGYGELALACECELEVFQVVFTAAAGSRANELTGDLSGLLVKVSDGAAEDSRRHAGFLPHGSDPDFEEALALAHAGVGSGSAARAARGIAAARRCLRRHPSLRTGWFLLARLLAEAGAVDDALVELDRARRLPRVFGAPGPAPGAIDVTRAEIAVLEEDSAALREALEAAKERDVHLHAWWFDAKKGGPFAGRGLPQDLVEALGGKR